MHRFFMVSMKNRLCLCFFGYGSLEGSQILNLEGLDIGRLAKDIFFCHADVDIGALLEEFWSLRCITDDEERHDQLGCHIVETAGEEVLSILILQSLHVGESLLIDGDEFSMVPLVM